MAAETLLRDRPTTGRKDEEERLERLLVGGGTRAATCWRPQMKGLTLMVNSVYNGSRFEDLWLDN